MVHGTGRVGKEVGRTSARVGKVWHTDRSVWWVHVLSTLMCLFCMLTNA